MPKSNSTAPAKPSKPYPEFPLFPHRRGQWVKKINGKQVCFGVWAEPDAALAKYLEQAEALHAGKTPRPSPHALTVKETGQRLPQPSPRPP